MNKKEILTVGLTIIIYNSIIFCSSKEKNLSPDQKLFVAICTNINQKFIEIDKLLTDLLNESIQSPNKSSESLDSLKTSLNNDCDTRVKKANKQNDAEQADTENLKKEIVSLAALTTNTTGKNDPK